MWSIDVIQPLWVGGVDAAMTMISAFVWMCACVSRLNIAALSGCIGVHSKSVHVYAMYVSLKAL